MTDVGGNARGMLVGDRMNPWQQNNEHKQYADNSAGSVLAGTCLCLCLSRVLYVDMSAINCEHFCCISV